MTKAGALVVVVSYIQPRPNYTVTLARAEIMVARGHARWAADGTRRIYELRTSARGEQRFWRKVTNRSKSGAALYSTMQLVPGVSQGRNTGSRHSTHSHTSR